MPKNFIIKKITSIKDYLIEFFSVFIHNRIGTKLYKSERENINMLSKPDFIKGNLMIYKRRYEDYEWVIFIEDDASSSLRKKIISMKDNIYNHESVFSSALFGYPEKVFPETNKNMRYDESYIYETYNFNNLEK